MQIILESGFWPSWNGPPNDSLLPATTYYDYVRVWTTGTTQTPIITPKPNISVPFGTALFNMATANMPGTFAYNPTTAIAVGSLPVAVTFTPTTPVFGSTTTSYTQATATIVITVTTTSGQTVPTITPKQGVSVPAGTTLTNLATATVPGTFTYNPTTATTAGSLPVTITFLHLPTPPPIPLTATTTITVTTVINKITPLLTPTTITTLGVMATDPVTQAVVPGIFTYTPKTGSVVVTFAPIDTTNYVAATYTLTLH